MDKSVCKKWNQLARDGSLWRRLDLRPYKSKLSPDDLERLVNVYGSDSTRDLRLLGNYVEDAPRSNNPIDQQPALVVALDVRFWSHVLHAKARLLTYLTLECLDLSGLDFDAMCAFERLESLSIAWSNLSETWFRSSNSRRQSSLAALKSFYLIRCSGRQLDCNDVNTICSTAPGSSFIFSFLIDRL